jgi:choline dehydrogenase
LQDHLEFYFQVECREPITLYSAMSPLAKAWIGMRWLLRHDGPGATNHFETGGFVRSRAGVHYPDLQYHFLPLAVTYDGIRFNYMSHSDDWTAMRAAVRLTREIFAQPAFDRYRGREIQPGDAVRTDAEIDAFVREKVESAYHPCGTCRMGRADDPQAVVDPACRVIGLEGLRVIDSSIMPTITTGNLNAPTIMIGEKGADHVRGRALLPAANVPVYAAANWQTAQR